MSALFNQNPATQSDPSDTYANEKQLYLSFYSLVADAHATFKAFVKDYKESFASDWSPEEVFGRNDPLLTFRGTKRTLNVAWDIPAFSLEEAKMNMYMCDMLAKFMYPGYTEAGRANTLSKPPLMRVRFANLIRAVNAGTSGDALSGGLLVAVQQLNIDPSFDASSGFFDPGRAKLYPKTISISCQLVPLHEHPLGWAEGGGAFSTQTSFPWGDDEVRIIPGGPESVTAEDAPFFETAELTFEDADEIIGGGPQSVIRQPTEEEFISRGVETDSVYGAYEDEVYRLQQDMHDAADSPMTTPRGGQTDTGAGYPSNPLGAGSGEFTDASTPRSTLDPGYGSQYRNTGPNRRSPSRNAPGTSFPPYGGGD